MKPYLVTYKFYYNGKCKSIRANTMLCESPGEGMEYSGADFEGLWNLSRKYAWLIPLYVCETKKGKKSLCIDGELNSITPKNCKPWKFVISIQETIISMERLMQFNTEDVIQYLKERGMTACPILK